MGRRIIWNLCKILFKVTYTSDLAVTQGESRTSTKQKINWQLFFYAVPPPKLYVQLSPVRVSVDVASMVWLSAFLPHVARALATAATVVTTATESSDDQQLTYIDVRAEAIMPKVTTYHLSYVYTVILIV